MVDFQIEVKKGSLSIRLSGTSATELLSAFDDALDLFKIAEGKLAKLEMKTRPESEELKELEGIPTLKNPDSIRDAISQLMATEWGRTPRTLSEIVDVMEISAVYYSRKSVSSSLSKMTRSGLLRRMQSSQGYKYVSGIRKKSS